jgi:tetratricopeptide (TPR) repeat protein
MHRFLRRTPRSAIRTFAARVLLVASIAAIIGAAAPAVAQEGVVTLRGDPAAEAAERERLFTALAAASNTIEAQDLTSRIWALWFHAPNAEAATIMEQALERRTARDYPGAAAILDRLVESAPDWAEAWNQRATIRYLLRDFEGSLADIDRVLALEPKHFGALSGEAMILLQQGKMAAGQLVLRKAVAIHPFLSERALLAEPDGQDI